MGNFSSATGIFTFIMMFIGKFILEKFGWAAAAYITPITLLTTGIGFFSLSLFPAFFAPITQK
jgi:AAA family ATP:ADP antiporter